jgi:hypothetical protein
MKYKLQNLEWQTTPYGWIHNDVKKFPSTEKIEVK